MEWTGGPPQQDLQDKAKVDILQYPKGPLLLQMNCFLLTHGSPHFHLNFNIQFVISLGILTHSEDLPAVSAIT